MGASPAALLCYWPYRRQAYNQNASILAEHGISPRQVPAFLSEQAVASLCKPAAILACFPRCDAGTASTINADDDMDESLLPDDDPPRTCRCNLVPPSPSPQLCPSSPSLMSPAALYHELCLALYCLLCIACSIGRPCVI